jgi:hypothetical protein
MAAIKNDTVPANFRIADYKGLTAALDTFTQFMLRTNRSPLQLPYLHTAIFTTLQRGSKTKINVFIYH